jgi:hypothetical protein
VAQQEKLHEQEALARRLLEERSALAQMLLRDSQKKLAEIQAQFDDDMRQLGGMLRGPKSSSYRDAVADLRSTLLQLQTQVADERKELTTLAARVDQQLKDHAKDLSELKSRFNEQVANFLKQLQVHASSDEKHVADVKKLTDEFQQKNDEFTALIDKKTTEITGVRGQLARALDDVATLKGELNALSDWNLQRPDGRILSVNVAQKKVVINVGRSDNLRLNLRFAVFPRQTNDPGTTSVEKGQRKAWIEVTQFVQDTLAEARIVSDDIKRPILDGDVIFTPLWSPGERERYMIAGDFDVDGDRKRDNELIRTLVEMSGGEVESELSIHTRWLLLGDRPTDSLAAQAYDKLRADAVRQHIKIMTLPEFSEYTDTRELQRLAVKQERSEVLSNRTGEPRRAPTVDSRRRLAPVAAPKPGAAASQPNAQPARRAEPGAAKKAN